MRIELSVDGFGRRDVEPVVKYLSGLEKGSYSIEIKKEGPAHSDDQRRAHWKRCSLIVDNLNEHMRQLGARAGYSKDAIHEAAMHRAGFHDLVDLDHGPEILRWSSKILTKEQYSVLFDVTQDMAEFVGADLSYIPRGGLE